MSDENPSLLEFSQDLNDAVAPSPIPAGEYPATIVKAEVKTSQGGNRYLALQFRVEPDAYPADFTDGNPEGELISYNRLMIEDSGRGRWRMRKFLEAVGASLGRSVDPNELIGLAANIGITHGSWEGEARAEISKITSAS